MINNAFIYGDNGKRYEFYYEGNVKLNNITFYIFSREVVDKKEVAIFREEKNGKYKVVDDIELCKNILKEFFVTLLG